MEKLKCNKRLGMSSLKICGSTKDVSYVSIGGKLRPRCKVCLNQRKAYNKERSNDHYKKHGANKYKNLIQRFKNGEQVKCIVRKCPENNPLAVKIHTSRPLCKTCFNNVCEDRNILHLFKRELGRELLKHHEFSCEHCQNKATLVSGNAQFSCEDCRIKAFELKNLRVQQKMLQDEEYRIKKETEAQNLKNAKRIKKLSALNDSLEIAKIFFPKLNFDINNIREELVREVIFDRITEITGIKWKNEKFIALTTFQARAIDVYIPEVNLFIEYKNTAYTQIGKFFKEEMEGHYNWIENSPYKGAHLISVSTNGSMCDYNILQFLYLILRYLRGKNRKKPTKTLEKRIENLHVLIRKLKANKHLFTENVWPELLTNNIITKMLESQNSQP